MEEKDIDNRNMIETDTQNSAVNTPEEVGGEKNIPANVKNNVTEDVDWMKIKQPLWVDMCAIMGVFVISIVIGAIVSYILLKLGKASMGFSVFTGYVINFGIPIFFAAWFLKKRGKRKKMRNFFRMTMKKVNPTLILWGFVLVMITSVVIEPLLSIFPDVNMEQLQRVVDMGGWSLLMMIVAAPILEEIFFRGIIQEELTTEYGGLKGVLLAAAFFGLAHIQVPQQAVNAFFIGIILGYIYVKTKSLVPVIIIHALNNAIAYLLMLLFRDRVVALGDIIGNNIIYWVVYALCVFVFLVASVSVYKQIKQANAEK